MADDQRASIADRTILGAQQIMERALNYVDGLEKIMITRGIQALYPRIEQRIRRASEEDLLVELKYLRELLDHVLNEPKEAVPKKRTRTNRRDTRKPKAKT